MEGILGEDYLLEVSSPGEYRPLRFSEDFRPHLGREIQVRMKGDAAGRRKFKGTLLGAGEDRITLRVEGGEVEVVLKDVKRARLAPRRGEHER